MKWTVITLLCGIISGISAPAPTSAMPEGNRYLFVVETSSAISRIEHGGRQAVFDLIHSGIDDRLQPGDTIGVWTFHGEVSTGTFPIQVWNADKKVELASLVGRYLKEQPYKGRASLDEALTTVMTLVRTVKDLTVVVVCSGDARLNGKGSFAELSAAWKQKSAEARKAKKPVLIALAAESGEILQHSVTLAGEAISLSYPPPRLVVTNEPAVVAAPTNPPVRVARAPIIMQGPQGPPKPKPAPVEPTVAPPETNPVAAVAETNTVAVTQTSPAPPPPTESVQSSPVEVTKAQAAQEQSFSALLPDPIPVAAREPQMATITPARPAALSPTALVLAGVGLMAVGLTLGTWLLVSSRKGPQLSSISQSMSRVRREA